MTNLNSLPDWLIGSPSNDYKSIYEQLGWKLIPIPTGSKAPTHREWNKQENCKLPDNWQGNIGIALAYSNVVSIDIDNWLKATKWLNEKSISLDALYNATDTIKFKSGKEGSAKLLYRLPEGIQPLESKKIHIKTPEGMNECVLEFRCATRDGLTVQDVLPPSIHPETQQPYKWVKSDELSLHDYLANMPDLPDDLLNVWLQQITPPAKQSARHREVDWTEVERALQHISPDCGRDEWIRIGMALHHADAGGEKGFSLWNNWSKGSTSKYPNERELLNQWHSFSNDKSSVITIDTLFAYARDSGYTKDLSNSFHALSSDWREKYMVSKQEIEKIEQTEWIYEDLIPSSHIVTIVAEPNAGKTTILFHIACQLAQDGYNVTYVNADIGAGDAKDYVLRAESSGVSLLLPDMKIRLSMENVVDDITALNNSGNDFNKQIFFFDTLKKMTDVINKRKVKELLNTLRGLSAKGATIVLLAHTNKYKDDEGKPIYEGTGDIRSDSDELIYFIPVKNSDGSITVSTEVSKQRKQTKPITFKITPEREVTRIDDYIQTREIVSTKKNMQKDKDVITCIIRAIRAGQTKQCEIIESCKNELISVRRTQNVLHAYENGNSSIPLWEAKKGDKNAKIYSMSDGISFDEYFSEI